MAAITIQVNLRSLDCVQSSGLIYLGWIVRRVVERKDKKKILGPVSPTWKLITRKKGIQRKKIGSLCLVSIRK